MFKKTIKKTNGLSYDEVMDRYYKLSEVTGLTKDQEKVSYARSKNLIPLRKFAKENSRDSRIPTSPELLDYQKEFQELRGKYLLTDKEGKAVMQQVQTKNGFENVPVVDVANPELIKKQEELSLKFKAAIKEREDDLKAYAEFMSEAVPTTDLPTLYTVNRADAPGLDQAQVDACYWFIKEEEDKEAK